MNERVLRGWIERWNAHDVEGLSAHVTGDYVHHEMSGRDVDLAGFQAGFGAVIKAFPDIVYTIEHVVSSSDSSRRTWRASVITTARSSVSPRPAGQRRSVAPTTAASPAT